MVNAPQTCGRCRKTKPAAEFYGGSTNTWCRDCCKAHRRARTEHAKQFGKNFRPMFPVEPS